MNYINDDNEQLLVEATTMLYYLSVDWENFDRKQPLRNDGKMELPVVIKRKTKQTIRNFSLLCYETGNTTLFGKRNEICEIMDTLRGNGCTSKKLDTIRTQLLLRTYIDPQTIKFITKNTCLIIDGVAINFKENSMQTTLLRAMFGMRGKNRVKLEFMDLYDIWATEENNSTTWEQLCLSDGGKKKAAFIKSIKNAATSINNKVRKAMGGTENFLDTRNNVCKINPKLLKPSNI